MTRDPGRSAVGAVANSFSGDGEKAGEPKTAGAESGAAAWDSKQAPAAPAVDCSGFMAALNTCLTKNPGDIAMCQQPMDMLRDCKFEADQGSRQQFA